MNCGTIQLIILTMQRITFGCVFAVYSAILTYGIDAPTLYLLQQILTLWQKKRPTEKLKLKAANYKIHCAIFSAKQNESKKQTKF